MRTDYEPLSVLTDPSAALGDAPAADARESLQNGIKAAQAGNRAQARVDLTRAAELDPHNENAWLWLASISEFPEELLEFLEHVLGINPENERALEWMAATKSLLAKTFVQRGIDALHDNQKPYAAQFFDQALWYDQQNPLAWLWKASLCESEQDKIFYLQRAVDLDPENASAVQALNAARSEKATAALNKAKTAAVDGRYDAAMEALDAFLDSELDCAEAWLLRSHLATDFNEKIMCLDRVLATEPDNSAARENREWLSRVVETVHPAAAGFPELTQDAEVEDVPTLEAVVVEDADIETDAFGIDDTVEEHIPIEDFYHNIEPEPQTVHFETYENGEFSKEESITEFAEAAPQSFEEPGLEVHTTGNLDESERTTDGDDQPIEFISVDTFDQAAGAVHAFAETVTEYDTKLDEAEELESIPMPEEELTYIENSSPTSEFSTNPGSEADIEAAEALDVASPGEVASQTAVVDVDSIECPFCGSRNVAQSISCHSCKAVLTLSDLELLLANNSADQLLLRRSVSNMEARAESEHSEEALTMLALGHLNLRNWESGLDCLQKASQINSNNVFLSSQANALHIRLDELRQQKEAHEKLSKGKTILVVDDSPTVCKLVAGKLEKCGHEVYCSNDGPEALELLKDLVPDLILLDINMPKMDGYQVCKLIRNNHPTQNVPVVMISGKDGFFDKVRGRMAGTTGYMTKPFGPETLMKAVETYLHGDVPEAQNP
jgi:twitching motility two-component system response regulator PilG